MNKGLVTRRFVFHSVFGITLISAVHYLIVQRQFEQFASYIAYPFLVMQRTCVQPLQSWFAHNQSLEQMRAALIKTEHEKEDLQAALIRSQAALNFVQESKELQEFRQRYDCAQAVIGQVLVKHISEQGHFFILDAGESKGIKKNMVAVYKDHLIGKVVEVYPYYCKVLLITDATCKVSAYCSTTKASGIHVGMNDVSNAALLHVSHLSTIKEGDLVLSSGDGLIFPRGFALGNVKVFKRNDLFYDVYTKPLVDIHTISYCYLLQKGNETITYHAANSVQAPKPAPIAVIEEAVPVEKKTIVAKPVVEEKKTTLSVPDSPAASAVNQVQHSEHVEHAQVLEPKTESNEPTQAGVQEVEQPTPERIDSEQAVDNQHGETGVTEDSAPEQVFLPSDQ